jgi:TusE/DsrC/DsvC family sulfur relay protein
MRTQTYAGRQVSLDDEGFMTDRAQWVPEMAEEIAHEVGLASLTPGHWKVITFCREDAAKTGQSPGLRRVSQLGGVAMKELYVLFPKGPGKLAARIAGLPKPKSCV